MRRTENLDRRGEYTLLSDGISLRIHAAMSGTHDECIENMIVEMLEIDRSAVESPSAKVSDEGRVRISKTSPRLIVLFSSTL